MENNYFRCIYAYILLVCFYVVHLVIGDSQYKKKPTYIVGMEVVSLGYNFILIISANPEDVADVNHNCHEVIPHPYPWCMVIYSYYNNYLIINH